MEHTWHTVLAVMQAQYKTYIHSTQLTHTTSYTESTDSIQSSYHAVQNHMIYDTDIVHNIRHTMPDLNNSCATLTVYNMSLKIQHSIT